MTASAARDTRHPFHRGDGVTVGHRPNHPQQPVAIPPAALEANTLVVGYTGSGADRILAQTLACRAEQGLATIGQDLAGNLRRELPDRTAITNVLIHDMPYVTEHNPLAADAPESVPQIVAILRYTAPVWDQRIATVATAAIADLRRHNSLNRNGRLSLRDLAELTPPPPTADTAGLLCHGESVATDADCAKPARQVANASESKAISLLSTTRQRRPTDFRVTYREPRARPATAKPVCWRADPGWLGERLSRPGGITVAVALENPRKMRATLKAPPILSSSTKSGHTSLFRLRPRSPKAAAPPSNPGTIDQYPPKTPPPPALLAAKA